MTAAIRTPQQTDRRALAQACRTAGFPGAEMAEPLRLAENETWRLPDHQVVVRIVAPGQALAAGREVRVARWLAANDVPTLHPLDIPQPVDIDGGRAATFWQQLPDHRHGTITDVATALRALHSLPAPEFLPPLDPFVRVADRLAAATTLNEDDRRWLSGLSADLAAAWRERPPGAPDAPVHGDAWPGNIVRTTTGHVLMIDLERFSVGPPEWDLVSTAVRFTTTGAVTASQYATFCTAYGGQAADVTQWSGYATLAGIRELRMITYAAQHAARHPKWADQAQHRIDCLRGRRGPRPWHWTGIL
ncbi:aminoglycoside phosphotransferase family protein [Streptomyces sp. HSW2009]|uniref:phosphotransferase family protein n=1 Tax=Streptomyces sp. HSW2009 TaxID=3142890 RepID=UPI0032EDBA99